jgi:hypothetical protein
MFNIMRRSSPWYDTKSGSVTWQDATDKHINISYAVPVKRLEEMIPRDIH